MKNKTARLIMFDGVCGLCHDWVRFVIRHDRKRLFKFVAMQSEKGQAILRKRHLPQDNFKTLVYLDGDRIYYRSRAIFEVIRRLAFPANMLMVFNILPGFVCDFVYARVAVRRYQLFGKRDECLLMQEYGDRFL